MWTNSIPVKPAWYWVMIDGREPEICQLMDNALWTSDRELGMAEAYVRDRCRVWGSPIEPPDPEHTEQEAREAADYLAKLGGTMPDLEQVRRQRMG
jgi:hypothetical protein